MVVSSEWIVVDTKNELRIIMRILQNHNSMIISFDILDVLPIEVHVASFSELPCSHHDLHSIVLGVLGP